MHRLSQFTHDARLQLTNSGLLGFTLDGGIISVILNLYMVRLGFGPELIGQVNSVGMLAFALLCLPGGALGGRWGQRRVMLISAIVMLLGMSMIGLTDLLSAPLHAGWLMLSYSLVNAGMAGYYANSTPFLIAHSTPAQRTQAFAMQSAFFSIFGFLGSLIGGNLPKVAVAFWGGSFGSTLDQPAPYRFPLWIAAGILIVVVLVVLRMQDAPPEPPPISHLPGGAPNPLGSALRLIVILSLVRFFQVAGAGTVSTFFNVYMDAHLHVSTSTLGLIQASAKLIGVPAALAVPALTRRFGTAGTTNLATIIVVLSTLPIAFSSLWWVAALGYMGIWGATPMRYSAYTVYSMERTPSHLRGTMNGAQEMLAGLSFALIAFVGGYVVADFGYTTLFLIGAGLTLVGTGLLWGYEQKAAPP